MKKILAFAVFICTLSFPSVTHAQLPIYPTAPFDAPCIFTYAGEAPYPNNSTSSEVRVDFTIKCKNSTEDPSQKDYKYGGFDLFVEVSFSPTMHPLINSWNSGATQFGAAAFNVPSSTPVYFRATVRAVLRSDIYSNTASNPSTGCCFWSRPLYSPIISAYTNPNNVKTITTIPPTTTTTTVAPITTTTVTTNPPIASYSKPLSPPSMAPYSIMAQFPVPSNLSLLQLSMQPGCCYSERIVCIDDKNREHSWNSVNYPDYSKRYYDIVGVYDIYTTFSIKCLNSNSAGNSSWSPWYTYYGKTRPPVQPPVVQFPVISAPTATLPNVQAPIVPAKPQWKYVTKKVLQTIYSDVRTGAICRSGKTSTATRNGACSHHGGVAKWLTLPPKQAYVNKKYKCYLNETTNKYTRNCVSA